MRNVSEKSRREYKSTHCAVNEIIMGKYSIVSKVTDKNITRRMPFTR